MLKNTKGIYIRTAEFEQLSEDLIADMCLSNKALDGNRHSDYFVLAKGLENDSLEVTVSVAEVRDTDVPYYTVFLVDEVNNAGETMLYHTTNIEKSNLIRVLQEIWTELTEADEQYGPASAYVDKAAEFAYLKSYIMGACLDNETSVTFLYSLWVSYCLHQNIIIDSPDCEEALVELWKALEESDGGEVSHWENYTSFEEDMCRDLR